MRAALLSIVPAIVALAPSAARAQFTAVAQDFGGRTGTILYTDVAGGQPIGREECVANQPIPILLSMVPQTIPMGATATKLDVFYTGTTSACQTAANRMMGTMTTPPCDHVTGAAEDIAMRAMFVTANLAPQTLFGDVNGGDPCNATSATQRRFYFLAATQEDDQVTDFTSFAFVDITLDPAAPAAPVLDGAAVGDASIDVTFDAPTAQIYEARLYLDPNGCADGMTPSSTTLVAGMAPTGTPIKTNQAATPAAVVASGTELGLDYGESAAVGVTFVDRARNESVLSNVVCVTRVQVPGFWDGYCMERGLSVDECSSRYASCAASPGAGAGLPLAAISLALLAIARRRAR